MIYYLYQLPNLMDVESMYKVWYGRIWLHSMKNAYWIKKEYSDSLALDIALYMVYLIIMFYKHFIYRFIAFTL